MFSFNRPTKVIVERQIAQAGNLPSSSLKILSPGSSIDPALRLPFGFAYDHSRSRLGQGEAVFQAAKQAFGRWANFDLGWVRVANPQARIAPGQIVAVEVHSLGLWTLNLSRITATIDTRNHFGFIYATTAMHVEQGDERFLLEFDPATGDVWYELEAVSRPRDALARLGYPVACAFQHKFARDSHRRVREEVIAKRLQT